MSPSFTWLSQSSWVLLLQALTCGLDPPSTPCAVQRGWVEGGAAARSSQTGGAARAGVSKSQAPREEGKRRAPERRGAGRLEVRALGGPEEPGDVPAGERRKGQPGLGRESPGRDRRDHPRRGRMGRKGWEVRVPRERRALERTVPGEGHPEMGQERLKGRIPGEKNDPELERPETSVRKGEALHLGDEFSVSER